jgi:hypothetical protein
LNEYTIAFLACGSFKFAPNRPIPRGTDVAMAPTEQHVNHKYKEMLWSGLIDFRTSDGVDESGTLVSLEATKLNEGVHLLVPVHL